MNRYTYIGSKQLIISLIVLILCIPIFIIFSYLLQTPSENWFHIYDNLLGDYIINSILLITGTSLMTLLMGISAAWIITRYHLPYSNVMEWLLVLPIAIPTYINGFAYSGLLDYAGPIRVFMRNVLQWDELYFDIMNIYGVIWVLSTVLYPYVFLSARTAFARQSHSLLEAASILGSSGWKSFFTVALPVARPAIVAGLMLVVMETLNDYGTVKYYGVPTFTTGIFRAWLSLGDLQSAIYLSSMLMTFVFIVILLEKWQRGKKGYESNASSAATKKIIPKGLTKVLVIIVCLFPILSGLIIPTFQLSYWAAFSLSEVLNEGFPEIIKNSFFLSGAAAIIVAFMAILLNYSVKMIRNRKWESIAKVTMLGYSVPGAVIAVGIMILIIAIDKNVIKVINEIFEMQAGLLITGSIFALLYAYLVRYFAVGYGPMEAAFRSLPHSINEAGRSLGSKPMRNLLRLDLPIMSRAIIAALLLVFVDVMKELPLTLILSPFNFSTLATNAFQYANDEMVEKAAPASLLIIGIGMIPVFFLNRLIKNK
ncbi:MAG: iron ABC transporter permease [Cyclobacteriaceae bacterium]